VKPKRGNAPFLEGVEIILFYRDEHKQQGCAVGAAAGGGTGRLLHLFG